MCGIVGYSGKFCGDQLQRAVRVIDHRGPDDSGVDFGPGWGLGHTRLSILDTSTLGHQPMVDKENGNVIAFNGEIYNFPELREELEAKGVVFRSRSDTEVLLKLYAFEGEGVLDRLNGIFAFALWDTKERKVLIARDALGVKPLYYSEMEAGVTFSSEVKALLEFVPTSDLDVDSLERYLAFLWSPGSGTPFKSVKKLGPGEAMIVSEGNVERHWKWYTLPAFRVPTQRGMSEDDAIEGTRNHLRDAVRRQMLADVPVGAFLSGGLDSSAIVAFAKEENPDIECFTIEPMGGDEAGNTPDLPYARRVADHLGVNLNVVSIDSTTMAQSLERMVEQLDEPLADPAPLNVLFISQLARDQGIKVLLSGAGGDDIFTGYRRHWALQMERYWRWLPRSVREGLKNVTSSLNGQNPTLRRLAKMFNGADLEGDERLVNYFYWAAPAQIRSLFSEEVQSVLHGGAVAEPMLDFLSELDQSREPLERLLALEQRFFLTDHNLTYTDKMSMAAGVEVRVPFLDLPLLDFAQQIPLHMKQRGREGKWVLKKAMEPFLPHDVIYRPKTGFGAPLRNWMRFELRELLGDLLSEESLKARGLFQPEAVQQLIADNDSGRSDNSYILLSLLCIEIWCRKFQDNQQGIVV
ncbi:asparagine synthase (glutamine-hydrolyzing) [Marinobacter adhaerens]|jgi:asparagine synthase (glutamine-hydrolysing)|uniref:asparagine synthase (glutamine-hydrolyzing) n=1 Tax=Marinobacter adhaerens TaxID=1033846 RepID=UPI003BA9C08C